MAQQRLDNFTVKTNLVSGYISLSGINFAQGTYIASDEQDLAYFNPLKAGRVIVKTGTASGEWYWDSTSTATAGDGVIEAIGYVTGRWIRSIGASTPNVLSGSRGVVFNSSKQIVQSDATKQQIDKTAMNVATIADARLLSTNLNNGQLVYVGGYYTNGDGGGGVFRYDSSDTSSSDNGGTIIVGTSSGIRLKRTIDGPVNILAWGAIGNGTNDNVSAFRKAVTNTPNIYIPSGVFVVGGEVSVPAGFQISGESAKTSIISASTTNFVFAYQSPLDAADENAGFVVSNLRVLAKNGFKFGDGTNSFSSQRHFLNGLFQNVYLLGTYNYLSDTNAQTSVVPTESELMGYGIGVYAAKLFNCTFSNVQTENYGIGFALFGCDINTIQNSRVSYNARNFHLIRVGTYGSQNKIQNCDLLWNWRVGGIYDENWITSIKDNYFEAYHDAAQFVRAVGTIGTLFWGNRIDCSQSTTPIMYLAPKYDYLVANNRYLPNTPASTIEVVPTYWTSAQQELVRFTGNSQQFPETRWPQCRYDTYSNPMLFDAWSPQLLGGLKVASYPWTTNASTSLPAIENAPDSIIVNFTPTLNNPNVAVKFSGVSIGGFSGFANITWGGVSVFSANLGFTITNALSTFVHTIRRPTSVAANSTIQIEVVQSLTSLNSIELEPVNYQLLDAAPTTGAWYVGDQVIKKTPVVGQPKGWSCTVSGTPGTWVSTGNL